ncbi:MAG: TSUP family transporter [Gemmatimonadaceae bacterium]
MTLTFLTIGLLAGMLAGIFGIGGGILIVPALVFFGKMTQRAAMGTSLGAMLLPVGALGVYAYWRSGDVNIRAVPWIALGMFVGAYAGAVLAESVSESSLRRAFAVLLVLVAGRLWMTT